MASLNYAIFPGLGKAIQQRDTGDGPVPPRATLPKWSINAMQAHLSKPSPNLVLLAAHRGLWRDTPENSEPGIRSSFTHWEMIETDLRKTKDYKTLRQLVITHDSNIARTTNGAGNLWDLTLDQVQSCRLLDRYGAVYEGGNWYPGDSLGNMLNDRVTRAGQRVLTVSDLFSIHKEFISGSAANPSGPIIIMDVKGAVRADPEFTEPARGAFNTMNTAIEQIMKLSLQQRKAMIFMVKFNLIPDPTNKLSTREYLEAHVPAYKNYNADTNPLPRLMLVFNPEDGTHDPPTDRNFQSLLSAEYLSHFEMNQYYLGDGCQVYVDYLTKGGFGVSTYSENAFFPQGVWDIDHFVFRNQNFKIHPVDMREIPDYTIANNHVGLVTTERPAKLDLILRQYNLRNIPSINL